MKNVNSLLSAWRYLLTPFKKPRIRALISIFVIVVTILLFAYYIYTHPSVLSPLLTLDPSTLFLMFVFSCIVIFANALVLSASLRLIGKRVHYTENLVLTSYSSVVNFFGPLQSGPGFRAVYLKTKHGVSMKKFFYTTLIFYVFFGVINLSVIIFAWLFAINLLFAVFTIFAGILLISAFIYFLKSNKKIVAFLHNFNIASRYFWLIGLGALLVSIGTAGLYVVEIFHIEQSVATWQVLVYTAAANLALFVSLTPGAIGFREAFLFFTQQLHHISSNVILSASIIDRGFYILFLFILFVLVSILGFKKDIIRRRKSSSQ